MSPKIQKNPLLNQKVADFSYSKAVILSFQALIATLTAGSYVRHRLLLTVVGGLSTKARLQRRLLPLLQALCRYIVSGRVIYRRLYRGALCSKALETVGQGGHRSVLRADICAHLHSMAMCLAEGMALEKGGDEGPGEGIAGSHGVGHRHLRGFLE